MEKVSECVKQGEAEVGKQSLMEDSAADSVRETTDEEGREQITEYKRTEVWQESEKCDSDNGGGIVSSARSSSISSNSNSNIDSGSDRKSYQLNPTDKKMRKDQLKLRLGARGKKRDITEKRDIIVKGRSQQTKTLVQAENSGPERAGGGTKRIGDAKMEGSSTVGSRLSDFFGLFSGESENGEGVGTETETETGGSPIKPAEEFNESRRLKRLTTKGREEKSLNDELKLFQIAMMAQSGRTSEDDEEVYERQRIKRIKAMLHMISMVADEYGRSIKPAVFVPVVERASKDKSYEVRRSAAKAVGALSSVVSRELAYDILYPVFVSLVQDENWRVRRVAACDGLPGLASVLSPPMSIVEVGKVEKTASTFPWPFLGLKKSGWATGGKEAVVEPKIQVPINRIRSEEPVADENNEKQNMSGWLLGKRWSGKVNPVQNDSSGGIQPRLVGANSSDTKYVGEKKWIQLIERLTSSKESNERVKMAVFEGIGKLFIAFANAPKLRDFLIVLVNQHVTKAANAYEAQRASNVSIMTLDLDSDGGDQDDEDEGGYGDGAFGELIGNVIDLSEFSNMDSSIDSTSNQGLSIPRNVDGIWIPSKSSGGPGNLSLSHRSSSVNILSGESHRNSSILFHVAYNFPAILQAVGSHMWDRLRDTYNFLVKVEDFTVRRTLACSLHVIARILSTPTLSEYQSIDLPLFAASGGMATKKVQDDIAIEASRARVVVSEPTFYNTREGDLVDGATGHSGNNNTDQLEQVFCLFLLEVDEVKMYLLKNLAETLRCFDTTVGCGVRVKLWQRSWLSCATCFHHTCWSISYFL
ncbi:hypothetical protein AX774_g1389 [Zancudomyces culisetae]|uniref:Uncharacterized protein n=1 Tax=Zancudomyces culisetae TaxID=1213189 RepID=A0A1R1PVX6_ZANCU|nr:hypothetical protein AX774_g1389 [Zancudomyces culisetae]|eukprot:OMH85063.1 hypothetical protein AX774_g1389 [Zancudomyces culisetae]